jgi:hypothetical protein
MAGGAMKYLLALWLILGQVAGAQPQDEMIKEFLEMRKRMLDRVFRDLDQFDHFFDDPFFKDNGLDDQFLKKHFRSYSQRSARMGAFAHEWVENERMKLLVIIPSSEKTQIQIEMDSKKRKILLKHQEMIERKNGDGSQVERGLSEAKTYLSYPQGVLVDKAQTHEVEGKIVICFPVRDPKSCQESQRLISLLGKKESMKKTRKTKAAENKRYFKSIRPRRGDINL